MYKYIYVEDLVTLVTVQNDYHILTSNIYITLMVIFDKIWAVIRQHF